MATPFSLSFDDREVQQTLAEKLRKLEQPRPLLLMIGEYLAETTKQRFVTSTAPDGSRWAPNSRTTLERYVGARGGYSSKTGKINKKGEAVAMSKKPLVARGLLGEQIVVQADDTMVEIGSNRIQAAVQQFGAAKGSLGGGDPWGDIPARPFLGVSAEDRAAILEMVGDYLE